MLEIIQGEDQAVPIDLTSRKTGKPFDLTGATEILVCFKSGAQKVEKKLTDTDVSIVGSPLLGQITTDLTPADTTSLGSTDNGTIVVTITQPAGITKSVKKDAFTVLEDPCL